MCKNLGESFEIYSELESKSANASSLMRTLGFNEGYFSLALVPAGEVLPNLNLTSLVLEIAPLQEVLRQGH